MYVSGTIKSATDFCLTKVLLLEILAGSKGKSGSTTLAMGAKVSSSRQRKHTHENAMNASGTNAKKNTRRGKRAIAQYKSSRNGHVAHASGNQKDLLGGIFKFLEDWVSKLGITDMEVLVDQAFAWLKEKGEVGF